MKKIINPAEIGVPPSYSNGIEVPSGMRTLYIAGQIAVDAKGATPEGIEAQTEIVFANLKYILRDAGMGLENLVKMTTFLTRREDFAGFVKTRTSILGANKPASTLVFISGLVKPELLVEVEAVAVG